MAAYVYILKCNDNTLYTGWTDDLTKRLEAHNSGKGAKYTRGRSPVELIWFEECANRSEALKREISIKKLSRFGKERLINVKERQ